MRSVAPEFDTLGYHAEAAPVRRARDITTLEPRLHVGEAALKGLTAIERAGLVGGPGAEPRVAAAGSEIGVGVAIGDALDGALDPHLSAQGFPVEEQGGLRVGRKL